MEGERGSGLPATMVARAGTVTKVETGVDDIDFAPGTSRPNGAFMALLEALIREIALALSLPYGFVYNMASFGGVTARLETQAAQRVFVWYQESHPAHCLTGTRQDRRARSGGRAAHRP